MQLTAREKDISLLRTYLPSYILRGMLDKHGITQFDGILLSSECKSAEAQGYMELLNLRRKENHAFI